MGSCIRVSHIDARSQNLKSLYMTIDKARYLTLDHDNSISRKAGWGKLHRIFILVGFTWVSSTVKNRVPDIHKLKESVSGSDYHWITYDIYYLKNQNSCWSIHSIVKLLSSQADGKVAQ